MWICTQSSDDFYLPLSIVKILCFVRMRKTEGGRTRRLSEEEFDGNGIEPEFSGRV